MEVGANHQEECGDGNGRIEERKNRKAESIKESPKAVEGPSMVFNTRDAKATRERRGEGGAEEVPPRAVSGPDKLKLRNLRIDLT